MNTLLLDRTKWDLCLDASNNIAMASDPYSMVQDVASACRLFINELWYGGSQGIPYFEQVLGHFPPLPLLKAYLIRAALTVPGVLSARVFISAIVGRKVTGQVQISTKAGSAIVSI